MTRLLRLTACFFAAFSFAVAAVNAQTTNPQDTLPQSTAPALQEALADCQKSPTNDNHAKVIKLAVAMDQLPPIPEEARKHFVGGAALFKEAKSADDSAQAADEFAQALAAAPWWPEARYNYALACEAAGKYSDAMDNLTLYRLFKLPEAEARTVQDKIYVLEAKAKKAVKDKEAAAKAAQEAEAKARESSPEVIAAKNQNAFNALLRTLDGRRYANQSRNTIDIKGKTFIQGAYLDGKYYEGGVEDSRVEIVGRETVVTLHEDLSRFQRVWPVKHTFIISEDGDKITLKSLGNDGKVYDFVYSVERK